MTDKPAFYVTTPIYYVNDQPHIGHAYTTVACDTLARFKRLDGYDVKFLTGTDEHGMKVYQAAQKQGLSPRALTDKVSVNFRDMCALIGSTHDRFIRTTDDDHILAVQAIWRRMAEADDIYLGKYSGWYSVRDEAFYGEEELTAAPGGGKLAPTGAPVEWVEEESYFFRLSAWQDRLLAFYEANPDFVQPKNRYNEVVSFVKGGLKDLSVSRTNFDWGVKVPGDERHVMYVWVDALTNYLTALGYPEEGAAFKKFWPHVTHVVGKDILRFHAVYWPAFLMSAGIAPPQRVVAHGWWMAEGQKMSKSLGNVIAPAHLAQTYGIDASRYFMLREVPFGNDGDFSHAQAVTRINAELANNIGNLVQRTLSMIAKNCAACVPTPGAFLDEDKTLLDKAGAALLSGLREEMEGLHFSKAIEKIVEAATAANLYIDAQAPWTLKKTDPARMATVLYVLAEAIRGIALALQPFVPTAAGRILDQLAQPQGARDFSCLGPSHALKAGAPLPAPEGVFPRIVEAAA